MHVFKKLDSCIIVAFNICWSTRVRNQCLKYAQLASITTVAKEDAASILAEFGLRSVYVTILLSPIPYKIHGNTVGVIFFNHYYLTTHIFPVTFSQLASCLVVYGKSRKVR